MKLITRQDLANAAAKRFRDTHGTFLSAPAGWIACENVTRGEILDRLIALGARPLPEQVNAVIGNDSWTTLTCNSCREEAPRVVAVDVTGSEYGTYLCENCVSNMAVLFLP